MPSTKNACFTYSYPPPPTITSVIISNFLFNTVTKTWTATLNWTIDSPTNVYIKLFNSEFNNNSYTGEQFGSRILVPAGITTYVITGSNIVYYLYAEIIPIIDDSIRFLSDMLYITEPYIEHVNVPVMTTNNITVRWTINRKSPVYFSLFNTSVGTNTGGTQLGDSLLIPYGQTSITLQTDTRTISGYLYATVQLQKDGIVYGISVTSSVSDQYILQYIDSVDPPVMSTSDIYTQWSVTSGNPFNYTAVNVSFFYSSDISGNDLTQIGSTNSVNSGITTLRIYTDTSMLNGYLYATVQIGASGVTSQPSILYISPYIDIINITDITSTSISATWNVIPGTLFNDIAAQIIFYNTPNINGDPKTAIGESIIVDPGTLTYTLSYDTTSLTNYIYATIAPQVIGAYTITSRLFRL